MCRARPKRVEDRKRWKGGARARKFAGFMSLQYLSGGNWICARKGTKTL